jgi:pyrimidine-nucleoside phosphorylase
MIPSRVIETKRDGGELGVEELEAFLQAYLEDRVPDYQMAAFLMATYFHGLGRAETDVLVRCMLESGAVLDLGYLDGARVDKHSTGGVGDKVSLVLAPLAAALGMYVPMMSGRGLGHTAGTLDKLEAIPGFRTALRLDEFRAILETVGCAMIGQTDEIAPLDRRLYALRDVTATVPVIPLIAASIMSKKLAEGLTGLLLDVKVGAGAFIQDEGRAVELARTMVSIGDGRGLPTVALLTAMDRPLGRAVGNAVETREAIACLRGEGPADVVELVIEEASEMLLLADAAMEQAVARERAREALSSGAALDRFARLVDAQGGDPRVVEDPSRIALAPERAVVKAVEPGTVEAVDPRVLGMGVVGLGGGRTRMDQEVDLGVGFEVDARPGQRLEPGRPLGTVYARDADGLSRGIRVLREAVRVGRSARPMPLISHRVTARDL